MAKDKNLKPSPHVGEPAWISLFFSFLSRFSPRLATFFAIELFSRPRRIHPTPPELILEKEGKKIHLSSGRSAYQWGEGTSVLLVHGWEGRGTQFHVMIRELLKAHFKVVAWDGPAHGHSPGKTTHAANLTVCLVQDLAELGKFDAAIGHSLGGAVLMQLSKLGYPFPKMVTISSPGIIRSILKRFLARIQFSPKEHDRFFQATEKKVGKTIDSIEPQFALRGYAGKLFLIHDQDDQAIPYSEFEFLKTHFPHFKYLRTEGLGHHRILKDSQVIKAVIRFIQEP